MPAKDGTFQAREFLFFTEDLAMKSLPRPEHPPERRVMWTILQLHYGDPNVHFELQPMPSRRRVELGLHFEGPPEANDLWAARLAARAPELMAALGDGWELEEWTSSWRRLHRTFAFERLTRDLGHEVAAELAKALQILGPMVREGAPAGLAPVATTAAR